MLLAEAPIYGDWKSRAGRRNENRVFEKGRGGGAREGEKRNPDEKIRG